MISLFNDPSRFGRVPDPPEPPEGDPHIEVGDFLKCRDKQEMLMTMLDLADEGIETEYRYNYLGKSGYWLEVISIDD